MTTGGAAEAVIATGLHVPEGPALLESGRVLFTEQTAGRISVIADGVVDTVAVTGGAPNSCAIAADGSVLVCQNGGVVGAWRSPDPRTPGIQHIDPHGALTTLATEVAGRRLVAPNDLAFRADGVLCFTDPAQPFDPDAPIDAGALYVLGAPPDVLVEVGGAYCNGIASDHVGRLVWVESYTRRVRRIEHDGVLRTLCVLPEGQIPDGLAVATDGRLFIASCGSHGISVVSPDGDLLDLLLLDDEANLTNCCFDGGDLVVTDFGMDFEREPGIGRLWRMPTDAIGAPVHRGPVPSVGREIESALGG